MTTNVKTAAGAKLYIGGTGALNSESNWVEVGEIVDFGEYGKSYELVTHNPVGNRKTFKFKGSYNEGALALQLGQDTSDLGQAALLTARDSDSAYNFKVELTDEAETSGATPTTDTFKGMVMNFTTQVGSVNSIVGAACNIEISGDITRTAASS
jgi:hypothetical protein